MYRKKIAFAFMVMASFITHPAAAEPYIFTQRIVNNIPSVIALTDTGRLFDSTYVVGMQPPNDVNSYHPGIFQIVSNEVISLTSLSYLASNIAPYDPISITDQGCKIVSLAVNAYHEVVETVETVAPMGEPVLVHCTCTAVEGDNPGASMIVNLGVGANRFTCLSTSQ
jgi:hypothetical protein